MWRIGGLRSRGGVVSAHCPARGGGRVAGYSRKFPRDITPILVPHRQEYSEVVAFRIAGPSRSVLYVPDIDSWEQWDSDGTRIEDVLRTVDVAYLDGTFFANGEIPGRDMTGFPHPFITKSMERFAKLPSAERAKVRFIHLNHTNAALIPGSDAQHQVEKAGMRIAEQGERFSL